MGLDTDVWAPPEGHEWVGMTYNMHTDRAKYTPEEQAAILVKHAVTWRKWSDGSISENTRLVDGTYRFDLYVPSTEPSMWCTYIYEPTTKDFTGEDLTESVRFIEWKPAASP